MQTEKIKAEAPSTTLIDTATQYLDKAKELGTEAYEGTEDVVRRHPTAAVVGGFVVGALVGILLARR